MVNLSKFIYQLFSDNEKRDDDVLFSEKELSDIEAKKSDIYSEYAKKKQKLDNLFIAEGDNWGDTNSEKMNEYNRRLEQLQEEENIKIYHLDNNKTYHNRRIDKKKRNKKITVFLLIVFAIIIMILFVGIFRP